MFAALAVVKYGKICIYCHAYPFKLIFALDSQQLKTTIVSCSSPDAVCGLLPSLSHKHKRAHIFAQKRATQPRSHICRRTT